MSKHALGRLSMGEDSFSVYVEGGNEIVADVRAPNQWFETTEDAMSAHRNRAERIVACVNACEGIEDPATYIAEAIEQEVTLKIEIRKLRAQRDEMLEALKDLDPLLDLVPVLMLGSGVRAVRNAGKFMSAVKKAKSAIASAEGK